MGTYLIVGGTGNVGGALARQLATAGHDVRIGSRTPAKVQPAAGTEAVEFDYDRSATWAPAFAGVDGAFFLNLGAPPEVIGETMAAARKAGVARGVGMTALGVEYLPATTPPRVFESGLIDSGLQWTILRPTWFMQNFSTGFVSPMVQKRALRLPAEDAATAFIDVRDIAAVAAAALTHEGHASKAYGLTGGEALTHADVAAILSAAIGKPVRYENVDDATLVAELTALGMPPSYAGLIAGLYGSVRRGEAAQVLPTVAEVTGRAPLTFADFAREMASALPG